MKVKPFVGPLDQVGDGFHVGVVLSDNAHGLGETVQDEYLPSLVVFKPAVLLILLVADYEVAHTAQFIVVEVGELSKEDELELERVSLLTLGYPCQKIVPGLVQG